ncbi:diacylglycerol kinase family protein [Altericroceibacterium endophyticum]|uniref:Diacylglycerol kinase n=1 Tax=Altericroceibacterium endophyticum TaxID=1808508 RepID=A0A6I4T717_9SPHN|nr:acylglycerol kinase family protein [Altericroceibacterium endophyticum]MXO65625.1 diacylglycerol kinase [Altericroceibacterium endophyticum]
MKNAGAIWLVVNSASGSNTDPELESLEECCAKAGFSIERVICFPDEDLPTGADLDAASIPMVAVFTGDGTINALVTGLYGWEGSVLVLPGGTMNLLYHRLHGDRTIAEVLDAVINGQAKKLRPGVVRSQGGDALAGLLMGPATAWNEVREAMRDANIKAMADGVAEAVETSLSAPMVRCSDPPLGRPQGYPLLMFTPYDSGIEVAAYHAETPRDYLGQGLALLKQNFREGPHDNLGQYAAVTAGSMDGGPIDMLVDGEPRSGAADEELRLVECGVDLMATEFND